MIKFYNSNLEYILSFSLEYTPPYIYHQGFSLKTLFGITLRESSSRSENTSDRIFILFTLLYVFCIWGTSPSKTGFPSWWYHIRAAVMISFPDLLYSIKIKYFFRLQLMKSDKTIQLFTIRIKTLSQYGVRPAKTSFLKFYELSTIAHLGRW